MFVKIPASKQSIAQRRPIYGVGINDANYITQPTVAGKRMVCPYYQVWKSMLGRSYSEKFHEKNPAYIGCTVDPSWHKFMAFRSWMEKQDWEDNALDKDVIRHGNKHYSPNDCCFVAPAVNTLLTGSDASRGNQPQGVYFDKQAKKYRTAISIKNKIKHIGYYSTPTEAESAYRVAKSAHIKEVARTITDKRVRNGLIKHAELISEIANRRNKQ